MEAYLFVCFSTKSPPMDFNLEEFLKMDEEGLKGLALGNNESEETTRSSKSSRWFGKVVEEDVKAEEPVKQDPARSLLDILQGKSGASQKGHDGGNQQFEQMGKKMLTAQELERGAGNLNFSFLFLTVCLLFL